jgi:hypothetical protein
VHAILWLGLIGAMPPITNGSADSSDPAAVALVDPTGRAGCTATVIESHTAITAAHCVTGFDPRILRVWFGSDVYSAVSGAQAGPMFDPTTLAGDVAMLTFRDPAPVQPLMLEMAAPVVGTVIRAVGYGTTAAGSDDGGVKREGSAMISDVQPTEFTALPQPSQPCHGDSGGPALMPAGTIGGVVSRGDTACSDHAIYARVDVAQSFITGYLAQTAPGTVSVGQACLYDGQCAGGPCLVAADDPELAFCGKACTHDSDCPDAMTCKDGECRYPEPSPGALGSTCNAGSDCTSAVCLRSACTRSCGGSATCPSGFSCTDNYCEAASGGGCGCDSGGSPAGALVIVLVFARARRTRRCA